MNEFPQLIESSALVCIMEQILSNNLLKRWSCCFAWLWLWTILIMELSPSAKWRRRLSLEVFEQIVFLCFDPLIEYFLWLLSQVQPDDNFFYSFTHLNKWSKYINRYNNFELAIFSNWKSMQLKNNCIQCIYFRNSPLLS